MKNTHLSIIILYSLNTNYFKFNFGCKYSVKLIETHQYHLISILKSNLLPAILEINLSK